MIDLYKPIWFFLSANPFKVILVHYESYIWHIAIFKNLKSKTFTLTSIVLEKSKTFVQFTKGNFKQSFICYLWN